MPHHRRSIPWISATVVDDVFLPRDSDVQAISVPFGDWAVRREIPLHLLHVAKDLVPTMVLAGPRGDEMAHPDPDILGGADEAADGGEGSGAKQGLDAAISAEAWGELSLGYLRDVEEGFGHP